MRLKPEDLGRLLFRAAHEPRRNLKRFLKDLGGEGSAEELDQMLDRANQSNEARDIAEKLERQRAETASRIEAGVDERIAAMIAQIKVRMQQAGMTQDELASACGWQQPLVSAYLSGKKEPGAGNLAKMAEALGCEWVLRESERGS